MVKEGKEKKIYTEELDSIPEEDEEEKTIIEKPANSTPTIKKPGEKTFVVLGGYPDIVNAIAKRGWKQSKDPTDKSYDFLYTLKNVDIPFIELKPNQLVNHFWKANQITRKSGLLKNLRNLYFKNVCIDNFYPRAYELSDKVDLEDFIEDFKTNRAICILKNAVEKKGENINKEEVLTSLDIIKRKLNFITCSNEVSKRLESVKTRPFPSSKEPKKNEFTFPVITDKEWEIISNENMTTYSNEIFALEKSKMIPITPEREHLHKSSTKNKKVTKPKKTVNKEIKKSVKNESKKEGFIMSEEDKKLEEEIKANFKKQQEEREIERKKFEQKLLEEEIKRRMEEDEDEEEKKKKEEEKKKEEAKKKEEEKKKVLTPEEKEEKWK